MILNFLVRIVFQELLTREIISSTGKDFNMQTENFLYFAAWFITAFGEPEPYESKGSSTVLRGQGRGNPPELPDKK